MKTIYTLEFLDDLNYATADISNTVFEFYTPDIELGTIQIDEWGKEISKEGKE